MNNFTKILILGSSGLIGRPLTEILKVKNKVFTTFHKSKCYNDDIELDLMSDTSIEKVFLKTQPNVVVNLNNIYNDLDFCEKNKDLVMRINGLCLQTISKLANKYDAFLVSLSSDFVFDGSKGNYTEKDLPRPTNHYGKSKYEGEKIIQTIAKNYCIIRTSMIFGKNAVRKTFPDRILDTIKQKKELKLINDQFMTPTYLENLCKMLTQVLEKQYGKILHLAGPKKISRYDFAVALLEKLDLSKDCLVPVSRNEFSFGKIMPKDSSLNTDRANSILDEKPENFQVSLEKYIKSR